MVFMQESFAVASVAIVEEMQLAWVPVLSVVWSPDVNAKSCLSLIFPLEVVESQPKTSEVVESSVNPAL